VYGLPGPPTPRAVASDPWMPPQSAAFKVRSMRLAIAQLNPVVGDLEGNRAMILAAYERASSASADLVCAGELALTGYPPEDLVLKRAFVTATTETLRSLAAATGPVMLVVGFVEDLAGAPAEAWRPVTSEARQYPPLADAAAVLRNGRIEAVYRKRRLPNYGVFDEARYFMAGTGPPVVVSVAGTPVGVTVCEDLWGEGGPVDEAAAAGAQVVLNLNASPYSRGKWAERERWAAHHACAAGVWIVYTHIVGGQDEIVFDGDSFVMAPDGSVIARAAQFATDLLIVDLPVSRGVWTGAPMTEERLDPVAEVYAALVLGTRDYVWKNGFSEALIGLSGGIDSALVAAVAADALGPDAVTGVLMPSPYSSEGSVADARKLVANLGIRSLTLPIEKVMRAFDEVLAQPFAGTTPGVAEENIQSRTRGMLLMALSNKFGDIVLATGNKSEFAVGYATLYGDMVGGFAVIKDVPKTLVYNLCRYRNTLSEAVPQAILDKAPSAELRPGQLDTDSLPPYDVLDVIIQAYVQDDRSIAEIVAMGLDADIVREVVRKIDRAEYKRRQAPPGVKITDRAFGKDRRLPITQAWSG
jgi:NAD+ synthase (glutamine-hydrolysing)